MLLMFYEFSSIWNFLVNRNEEIWFNWLCIKCNFTIFTILPYKRRIYLFENVGGWLREGENIQFYLQVQNLVSEKLIFCGKVGASVYHGQSWSDGIGKMIKEKTLLKKLSLWYGQRFLAPFKFGWLDWGWCPQPPSVIIHEQSMNTRVSNQTATQLACWTWGLEEHNICKNEFPL